MPVSPSSARTGAEPAMAQQSSQRAILLIMARIPLLSFKAPERPDAVREQSLWRRGSVNDRKTSEGDMKSVIGVALGRLVSIGERAVCAHIAVSAGARRTPVRRFGDGHQPGVVGARDMGTPAASFDVAAARVRQSALTWAAARH